MEKQTKNLSVQSQAKVDFNLTKDDIYLVLQEEKIEDITIRINDLKKQIEETQNNQEKIKEDITNKIKKLNKIPLDFICESFFYNTRIYEDLYDIDYLSELKNFRKSVNSKKHTVIGSNIEISSKLIEFSQEYEDSEGFEIKKSKSIILKSNKIITDLIEKYNNLNNVLKKLYIEINQLEYEILIVTSDNSYKAKFIKQIIKDSPEIMKLLK